MCRHYSAYNGMVHYQIKLKQVYWNLADCIMVFTLFFYEMFKFGICMVNIIFAGAVYLMHTLVIKPVNFIRRFYYLFGVLCVYKSSSFWSVQVVNTHFGFLFKSALLWTKIN